MKLKGDNTKMVDLGGRTMLPGFVDPHGHMMMGGMQALSANMLPPPDGEITSIADIQKTLRAWAEANKDTVTGANLIMGFGYDNSQLKELRPPTKEELDEVSKDIPVLIVHQSGHMGACNSKCIEVIGYTAETPDPAGGVIRRKEGSQEPSGILEEIGLVRRHSEDLQECRPRRHDGAGQGGSGAVGILRLHHRAGRPLGHRQSRRCSRPLRMRAASRSTWLPIAMSWSTATSSNPTSA